MQDAFETRSSAYGVGCQGGFHDNRQGEYQITGETRLICLLGSPVAHSLSPMMHNAAFRALGLPYCYLAFDIGPKELPAVVAAFRAMGVRGMNLTMPLKTAVLPLCDSLSKSAALAGSVNTVLFTEDGRMEGHSTDGAGFLRALEEAGIPYKGRKMTLFGTGGAAAAILAESWLQGVGEIRVFFREGSSSIPRIKKMIQQMGEMGEQRDAGNTGGATRVALHTYTGGFLEQALSDTDILVNASSVGMSPHEEGCLLPEGGEGLLPPDAAVFDAIYHPAETKLLRLCKARGLRTLNGQGMLYWQGAAAFQIWTGREMPRENP